MSLSKKNLMSMVKFYSSTYFVGYGSLMYPAGINDRGMKKTYKWSDLIPITVKGFKRSFCSVYKDLAYYGVYTDENSELNAVAFKMDSHYDYTMLLLDEFAHPKFKPAMYKIVDISDSVFGFDFPADSKIMILETIKIENDLGYIPHYYVNSVWDGIQHWGKAFHQRFVETGGINPDKLIFDKKVNNPWQTNSTIKCAKRHKVKEV